jgi:hypothetical protein
MRDWLTYQLSDFLLFSEAVYWRLFVLENASLWPLPLVTPFVMLVVLAVYLRRPDTGQRAMAAFLAVAWASIGWHFVWLRYAPVNWVMVYVAPLLLVQVAVLLLIARKIPARTAPSAGQRYFGYGLVLTGALVYPVLALLDHRPIASAEVIGIAPDPTAVASLGAACLMSSGWQRRVVLVLSFLWLGQSALTLFVLAQPTALAPVLVLVITGARLLVSRLTPLPKT